MGTERIRRWVLAAALSLPSLAGPSAAQDRLSNGNLAYTGGAFVGVDVWESEPDSALAFRGAFVIRYTPSVEFRAAPKGESGYTFADADSVRVGAAQSEAPIRVSNLYSESIRGKRKFPYAAGIIRDSRLLLCFSNPDYGTPRDRPVPVYVGLGRRETADSARFASIGADQLWQARALPVSSILHDFRPDSVVTVKVAGVPFRFLKGQAIVEKLVLFVLPNGTVAYPANHLLDVVSVVLPAR